MRFLIMANKIGVVLALDGEQEFTNGMKQAQNASKTLKQDLTALSNEFKGSANSMEYLSQKQQNLTAQQRAYQNTLNAAKAGQKNALENLNKQKEAVDKLEKQLKDAKTAMERYNAEGNKSKADEAAKEVDELTDALKKQETNAARAETRLSSWDVKVSKAQADVRKANSAIDQNAKYLDEAKSSADHCATSIDKFGKETQEAAGDAKKLSSSLSTGFMYKFASVAVDAAKELGRLAIEAGKYVLNVGSTFETSMSKVEALSGASGVALQKMSDKAKQLGASTRFSASEVADGFSYMALAGWDAEQMLSSIDGIVNLAAASQMDLAQASDMVTDYLSAFGLSAADAGKMADQMSFAQANSNTSTTQLGDAFGNCAANMHAAGQDMETTTAMLEALANQGKKGSEAGTALTAMMRDITAKMEDGKIAIGDTLVTVADSNGAFRDMTDILKDVEAATNGMESADRTAALAKTFTSKSINAMNVLLTEGAGNVEEYENALRNSDGAAADMAATMQNNLQGAVREFDSATAGLGMALYDQVKGPVTDAVRLATDAISGITDAITPERTMLSSFIEEIGEANDKTAASIEKTQQILDQSDFDTAKLEAYKDILIESNGAADEFSKYQLKTIVDELSSSIPPLAQAWDEETQSLLLNNEAIERLINNQEELARQDAMLEARTAAYKAQADAQINLAMAESALKQSIEEVNTAHGTSFSTWQEVIQYYSQSGVAIDKYQKNVAAAGAEIKNAQEAVDASNKQLEITNMAMEAMGTSFEAVEERQKAMAESTEEVGSALDEMAEESEEASVAAQEAAIEMAKAFDSAKESAKSAFSINPWEAWEKNEDHGIDAMKDAIKQQVENLASYRQSLDTVRSQLSTSAPELLSYIESLGTDGAQLVDELAQAFENGDTDAVQELIDNYKEALSQQDGIAEAIATDKTAIETGLQELQSAVDDSDIGSDFNNKIAENIQANTQPVEAAAGKVGEVAAKEITDKASSGIEANAQSVVSAAVSMVDQATSAATAQAGNFYSVGTNISQGLANGISANGSAAINAAVNVATQALAASKAAIGVASPSKRFRDELGKMIPKGVAFGIKQKTKESVDAAVYMARRTLYGAVDYLNKHKASLSDSAESILALADAEINQNFGISRKETVKKRKKYKDKNGKTKTKTVKVRRNKDVEDYYGEIYSAANDYMDAVKNRQNVSIKEEKKYWENVQKRLKKGTAAYEDATAKIKDLQEQIGHVDVAEALLDNYQVYYDMSEKAEMDYWDRVRKQYKKGTEDRIKSDKYYYDAKKKYTERLKDIEDSYAEKIESVNKRYTDALESRREGLMSAFDIFDEFKSESPLGKDLLFNMQTQAVGYEEWAKTLDEIEAKGIFSEELMSELTDKGPAQIASLKALLMLSNDELREYQKAYDRKTAAAERQATQENEELKKTVEKEVQELKEAEKKEREEVNKGINSDLDSLAKTITQIASDQTDALVKAFTAAGSKESGSAPSTPASQAAANKAKVEAEKAAAEKARAAQVQKEKEQAALQEKNNRKLKVQDIIMSGKKRSKTVTKKEAKDHVALWEHIVKNYGRTPTNNMYKQLAGVYGIKVSATPTSAQKTAILNKLKADGLKGGTRRFGENTIAWIDELIDQKGPEMIVRKSDKAIMTRLEANDAVVPADLASNLFKWGAIDPDQFRVPTMNSLNASLASGYRERTKTSDKTNDLMQGMAELLAEFLPYLAENRNIYLDGKTLVGSTSSRMSTELAMKARRRRA